MLTREEQDTIAQAVAEIIRHDKQVDSKVSSGVMSPKSGRESKARKWENFKDLLKELG